MKKKLLLLFVSVIVIFFVFSACTADTAVEDSSKETGDEIEQLESDIITIDEGIDEVSEDEQTGDEQVLQDEQAQDEDETNQKDAEKEVIPVTFYYQEADGYIIPVTRKIPAQQGIARAAVTGLVDSSIIREELGYYGLFPVLPRGTEILGLNIKDGLATIDFNSNILNYETELQERNILSSIVYTLTEFDTIDGVTIWINGHADRKMRFGTSLSGVFNRDNILINSDRIETGNDGKKVDIYLFKSVNKTNEYMLPVSVNITVDSEERLPYQIIEMLGKEYGNQLFTQIPQGTKLVGSSIMDGVLTLDFNEKLKSYGGGSARENGIIMQILFSMKNIDGVEKVKFLINGNEPELPEGFDLSNPVSLILGINDVVNT